MSESASTSSSPARWDSGDAMELRGLVVSSSRGVVWCDSVEARGGLIEFDLFDVLEGLSPLLTDLSANRFSSVPRSVLPPSSSESRPDSFRRDSILPNRFSKPSIYLALRHDLA